MDTIKISPLPINMMHRLAVAFESSQYFTSGLWTTCFFGPRHRSFKAQSFIDAGIGLLKSRDLSEQLNALDNKLELKQKIEGFINNQSGATDKL